MYCRKCGKEIDDEAIVCIGCGCAVEETKKDTEQDTSKTGIGILMGFFLGIIGLIIGLCLYKEDTVARKTFLKAWGITFGICFVLNIVISIIWGNIWLELLMGGYYSTLI